MIHYQTELILQNISKLYPAYTGRSRLLPFPAGFQRHSRPGSSSWRKAIFANTPFVTKGCLKGFSVDNNGFEAYPPFCTSGLVDRRPVQPVFRKTRRTQYPGDGSHRGTIIVWRRTRKNYTLIFPNLNVFSGSLRKIHWCHFNKGCCTIWALRQRDRYHNFCKKYPSLVNCLPQKEIAAFIGVTPEFFSKMRKRLSKGSWYACVINAKETTL